MLLPQQIDRLCDEFENKWLDNNNLSIEDFLRFHSLPDDDKLIDELIIQETDLRFSAGLSVSRSLYETRFPKHGNAIERAIGRLDNDSPSLLSQVLTVYHPNGNDGSVLGSIDETKIPHQLGDFEISNRIGRGSFGIVFRGRNLVTGEIVALKFPRNKTLESLQEYQQFCNEAELAGSLDHPAIVQTLGLRDIDGFIFIVQQYVEGNTLKLSMDQFNETEKIVKLLIALARAIAYAHRSGLIHRDLKPSNVLIDVVGNPLIADFGLSVHESFQRRLRGQRCGTPAYMSPEQAMGLTHQLDGRSDIWSLGVIFYELLTKRRPFSGLNSEELYEEIKFRNEKPLRMLRPDLDQELQRICSKCLSKAIRDRYSTADELAEDLENWLRFRDQWRSRSYVPLVPRGLSAFGPEDTEAFVELLPGPRNYLGVPESILFWKRKLESFEIAQGFSIGVIFGPSGSGKSSFARAGLIPSLDPKIVLSIYVEATARDTEVRLLKGLRSRFQDIPDDVSLPEILDGIRNGNWAIDQIRTLIVLDQFEQWIHGHSQFETSQLVQAFRHCDGTNVNCLLLIRDEYWMSTSRLLDHLGIDIRERENAQRIDRFEKAHALKVLYLLGRAMDKLPAEQDRLSKQQIHFLEQVVSDLAEEDRVASVHLTLFAEMFKYREWTLKELRQLGGVSAVGTRFLEETFESKTSSPLYHEVESEARVILELLLPQTGNNLKGHMRPVEVLRESVMQRSRSPRFDRALEVLDKDLRIITKTEPDKTKLQHNVECDVADLNYQLTHDYLVPAIRDWLDRKKKESWQGRTMIRYNELYTHWKVKKQKRDLPSLFEYLSMVFALAPESMTDDQHEYLKVARKRHLTRIATCFTLLLLVVIGFRHIIDNSRRSAANSRLEVFYADPPELIESNIREILPFAEILNPVLESDLTFGNSTKQLRAAMVLSRIRQTPLPQVLSGFLALSDEREAKSVLQTLKGLPATQVISQIQESALKTGVSLEHRVKLASVAMYHQWLDPAVNLFSNYSDPTGSTLLMDEVRRTWPDFEPLAKLLDSSNPDSVFWVLRLISLLDIDSLPQSCQLALRIKVNETSNLNTDPGVRAMTQIVAKRLIPGFVDPAPSQRFPPASGRNWPVAMPGQTLAMFIKIEPGEFVRGTNSPFKTIHQKQYFPEETTHCGREFWICSCELSYAQLAKWLQENKALAEFLTSRNRDVARQSVFPIQPVDFLSLNDALEFVEWLNQQEFIESYFEFVIPFPDEWEYACRSGSVKENFWGDERTDHLRSFFAVISDSLRDQNYSKPFAIRATASALPNRLGVHDMIGNVSEHTMKSKRETAISQSKISFLRGGSAINAENCWSAHVVGVPSSERIPYVGIRLIIVRK